MKSTLAAIAACVTLAAAPSFADNILFAGSSNSAVTLILNPGSNAVDAGSAASGIYTSTGFSAGSFTAPAFDPQYAAGYFSGAGVTVRNYFLFDLSGFTPFTINAAQIVFSNPPGGFIGAQALNFDLFPLDHPGFGLANFASGGGGTDAFNDLGDGPSYGGASGLLPGVTSVTVNLNQSAIALLEAELGSGFFPVGGSVDVVSATPEPSGACLAAAAFALLAVLKYKGARR